MEPPDESPAGMFKRILKMNDRLADALVAGEILTLEELAYVPFEELSAIQGVSESDAQIFRQRAREYLLRDVLGNAPGVDDDA
jgi:transcription termination/antitermination protein NusA